MVSYNGALDMMLPPCIGPMYRCDTSARYRTSRYVASRGHGVRARVLMNGRPELDRFLRAGPRDVGCAQATEILRGRVS
jgi:hypothetical protein